LKAAIPKNILLLFLPFFAAALMLTVIQPPISLPPLAWVSLVPFILACRESVKTFHLLITTYLVSLCYWLANLYWIFPVTWAGWAAFCLYTALLWPILAVCIRFCRIKKVPLFIAAPVLFVGAERLQGLFLGGFYWRLLAHSQYANITLIQIADIFGAAGVSFLIAMVNGLIAEIVITARRKNISRTLIIVKIAVVSVAVAAAVIYGQWRIKQTEESIETGPLVAAVQSNVPQSVKDSGLAESDEQMFETLLQSSTASVQAGAELIVWPETMVQAVLDARVLKYLDSSNPHRIFDEKLRQHAKDNAYLLVGAAGARSEVQQDLSIDLLAERFNSAFLYQPDGSQADKQYNKIHLVPFGEVVPFKKSAPAIHKLLMKFTPYDYDYSLAYGTEYTVFEITGARQYGFGVMICYEDTIPAIARNFAAVSENKKQIDWLLNISNDGWFVRTDNGRIIPSTELVQHTAICVFRAVENRLAVLRSVNTGISCLIDTTGRIKNGFEAGNLHEKALQRVGEAGWFADKLPIDNRTTFFSKCGQWLDLCCAVGLGIFLIAACVELKVGSDRSKK
jgi:apolipoprotein N-acyltransferase